MATLEQQLAQLQQANAQLLAAVNAQTAEVGSKMGQIDQRMETAGQEVTQFLDNAQHLDVKELGFTHLVGKVDADGEWHSIVSGLNSHFIGELILRAEASGFHGVGIFTIAVTFGSGQVHARTSGASHTTDVEARIVGDTYDYGIEIRSTSAANSIITANSVTDKLRWKLMNYDLSFPG